MSLVLVSDHTTHTPKHAHSHISLIKITYVKPVTNCLHIYKQH